MSSLVVACETIVDPPEEMMCRTPDAGILVDESTRPVKRLARYRWGLMTLSSMIPRGATGVMIGWSPHVASAVGARVDEIVSSFDPRTVSGPQTWLLMSAVGMRVAPFDALEMAAEGLENVLSRPFGKATITSPSSSPVALRSGWVTAWVIPSFVTRGCVGCGSFQ